MANEIQSVGKLTVIKGGTTIVQEVTQTRTLTGVGAWSAVLNIGTTSEAITFPGDLTAEGITEIQIKNLDATNYVEVGGDSGLTVFKVKALANGGVVKFAPSSGNPTIYLKANTAACNIQIVAVGT